MSRHTGRHRRRNHQARPQDNPPRGGPRRGRARVHGLFRESGPESGGTHGGCGRRPCARLRRRHRFHRGPARSMPARGRHHAHAGGSGVHRLRLHGTPSARPDCPPRHVPQAFRRPPGAVDVRHVRHACLGIREHGLLLRAGRRVPGTFRSRQAVRRHRVRSHRPVLGRRRQGGRDRLRPLADIAPSTGGQLHRTVNGRCLDRGGGPPFLRGPDNLRMGGSVWRQPTPCTWASYPLGKRTSIRCEAGN